MTLTDRQIKEGAIEITPESADQPVELIEDDRANRTYHVEVYRSSIRIGHDPERVRGRTLDNGVTHTVGNLGGEALYARTLGETAYVRVVEAAAKVESEPSRDVRVESGELNATRVNQDGVSAFSQSVSGSTNLQPLSVPDGYDVLITAPITNDADILIDGSFPLSPGDGIPLGVSDTAQITVEAESGTQQVLAITEVS